MDVYTIKVYRCDKNKPKEIVGTIEDGEGKGGVFTSSDELVELLMARCLEKVSRI